MSYIKRDRRAAWYMLAPALLMIGVFIVLPFLMSVVLSFTDQRLVPNPNVPTSFIGWRNYVRLAEDGDFLNAFWRTATFTILVVPLQSVMGFTHQYQIADAKFISWHLFFTHCHFDGRCFRHLVFSLSTRGLL